MNKYCQIPLDWNSLMYVSGGFVVGVVTRSMPDVERMLYYGLLLSIIGGGGILGLVLLLSGDQKRIGKPTDKFLPYILITLVGGAFGLSGSVIFGEFMHIPQFFADGILVVGALCGLMIAQINIFILPRFVPKHLNAAGPKAERKLDDSKEDKE